MKESMERETTLDSHDEKTRAPSSRGSLDSPLVRQDFFQHIASWKVKFKVSRLQLLMFFLSM